MPRLARVFDQSLARRSYGFDTSTGATLDLYFPPFGTLDANLYVRVDGKTAIVNRAAAAAVLVTIRTLRARRRAARELGTTVSNTIGALTIARAAASLRASRLPAWRRPASR